ncbi:apolipoprotein D and lipocalin family protein [Sphaerotilus hippei]|uniref:Outer membrane lipoprotein Blc n=1 Tax=Sphaerotilus hippei TaxID=744406 RepID=A0A318H0Z4_9BURK|nr:lipocalin family protein [Sphaerotilus hippei]PXW94155.1 apolipoprotein D and lipocalin family protein [Sphaerotilus hippei]
MRWMAGLTALVMLAGCASTPVEPLPVVASVDLERYLGIWHEVASLPNRFQSGCVADTQAEYRRVDGAIEVRNRCRRADGQFESVTGVAKVVPDSGNAKLRVSFFRPFYGNYWVLALDPDYRWALVGEPGRRFGWVLSRTPVLPAADLEAALARAAALGYDRGAFRLSPPQP